jgi:hypothetical protein
VTPYIAHTDATAMDLGKNKQDNFCILFWGEALNTGARVIITACTLWQRNTVTAWSELSFGASRHEQNAS